jgi:hypothetical protein
MADEEMLRPEFCKHRCGYFEAGMGLSRNAVTTSPNNRDCCML